MNPLFYALTRLAAYERLHPTVRAEMARQLVKLDPDPKPPVSSSLTAEPRDCPHCGAFSKRCHQDRDDGATECAVSGTIVIPPDRIPLTSIGPSGIGGEYQREGAD